MTTTFHTAIATSPKAAANAATINTPLGALDSALVAILDADKTLKADAVDVSAVIKDGIVTTGKLAADAVETAKIKDANVTAAKLAANAVETAKIKDANVTAAKLAADAVETAKIKDANVTLAKLSAEVQSAIAAGGAGGGVVNLMWDEINLHLEDFGNWNNKSYWDGPSYFTLVRDSSSPYGSKVLRLADSNRGKGIYLEEVGLQPGDVISAGISCKAASGTYAARLIFRTTGPAASAISTHTGSSHAFSNDIAVLAVNNITIPATAGWVSLVVYSAAPTSIDIYGMWIHRGAAAMQYPISSPFTATYLRWKEWETAANRLMVRNVDANNFQVYQPQPDDQSWICWLFRKLATGNWTYYGANMCNDNFGTGAYGGVTFDIGYSIYYTPDGESAETCGNHHLYDDFTSVAFYDDAGDTVDPTAANAAFAVRKLRIEQKGTLRHPDTSTTDHAEISRFIEITTEHIYEHQRLSWLTANNQVGYWNTGQLLASSANRAWIHNNGDAAFLAADATLTVDDKTKAYTWYASRKFAFEVECPTAEAIQLRTSTLKVYPRTINVDTTRGIGDVDHAEWYWRTVWDKQFEQRI